MIGLIPFHCQCCAGDRRRVRVQKTHFERDSSDSAACSLTACLACRSTVGKLRDIYIFYFGLLHAHADGRNSGVERSPSPALHSSTTRNTKIFGCIFLLHWLAAGLQPVQRCAVVLFHCDIDSKARITDQLLHPPSIIERIITSRTSMSIICQGQSIPYYCPWQMIGPGYTSRCGKFFQGGCGVMEGVKGIAATESKLPPLLSRLAKEIGRQVWERSGAVAWIAAYIE